MSRKASGVGVNSRINSTTSSSSNELVSPPTADDDSFRFSWRETRDFSWSENEEPHVARRRLILEKHPEIRQLFGVEPMTAPIVTGIFLFQLAMAYYCLDVSLPILFLLAYTVGGTLNHSLQLAVHELSHNLCFHSPVANKCLAIFANLVTCIPSSVTFQKYHMDHHQFQGVDGMDTDIPTRFEIDFFTNSLSKIIWIFLQPLFYAVRPTLVKPKSYGTWEIINIVVQILFNACILYFFGVKSFCYLMSGTILGLGLHPSAGHFIAEHYEFVRGQETYSYYGWWNLANFNVGYHNEHHDFPKIPWSRLPLVKKMAPEFYNLPCYTSYFAVFWAYVFDNDLGPHARIKRTTKDATSTRTNTALVSDPKHGSLDYSVAIVAILFLGLAILYPLYSLLPPLH